LYNPTQHPFFDQDDGQTIYFEGTYANFWGQGSTKAHYDYNQLMYKLDLSREATMLPSPVYRMTDGDLYFGSDIRAEKNWHRIEDIAFFAFPPDHHPEDLIPIYKILEGSHTTLSTEGNESPFMFALPATIDQAEKYEGQWDCSLEGFEAIDNYLPLDIISHNGNLKVMAKSRSMTVVSTQLEKDKFLMTILQYGKEYSLIGSVTNGKMKGDWSSSDGKYNGQWEGELVTEQWLPRFNASLFLLKSNSSKLCQVWENPFRQPVFDWEIEPY